MTMKEPVNVFFICFAASDEFHSFDHVADVTNTGNGKWGTGNWELEWGMGVWELVYSGNPLENLKWWTREKRRLESA